MSIPEITKRQNENGQIEYRLTSVCDWYGFDSFIAYLQKHWNAQISESADWVYSRRWVLRLEGVPISVYHDSQIGNYFLREDGSEDQSLLEKIAADVTHRLSQPEPS
jgi:hypothetical protein